MARKQKSQAHKHDDASNVTPRRAKAAPRLFPRISIVIVSRNEGCNLRRTVQQLQATSPVSSEIVVVDDGSTDGSTDFISPSETKVRLVQTNCLGVTKARNYGATQSHGEVIVFADAHVDAPSGWWSPILELLAVPSVGGVAPAISMMGTPTTRGYGLRLKGPDLSIEWLTKQDKHPYQVPIIPGCFLAMHRNAFAATGGFDDGMDTWGMSDIELSLRLWLLGYELWLVPQVTVPHLFRTKHPYEVKWSAVLHNKLRVSFVHFNAERTSRVVKALCHHNDFPTALAMTATGNFSQRRREMALQRRYDDNWFFERFGPDL